MKKAPRSRSPRGANPSFRREEETLLQVLLDLFNAGGIFQPALGHEKVVRGNAPRRLMHYHLFDRRRKAIGEPMKPVHRKLSIAVAASVMCQ
jgi:hypothetical protein